MRKILFIVIVVIMFTGCYTKTRHPIVDRDEEYFPEEISHRDVCNSCHVGSGKSAWEDPYALRPPYMSSGLKSWNDYYYYPWWADDSYYRGEALQNTESGLPIDPRSYSRRRGVEGTTAPAVSAPAGFGPLRKEAIGTDSTEVTEEAPPKKPETDRKKLQETSKRTKKKKENKPPN